MRYSIDGLVSAAEAPARVAPGADDQSLRYVASIPCPRLGNALLVFAVRYKVDGTTHWDSNGDAMYRLPVGAALRRTTKALTS